MITILGISAFYHDSAAVLLIDGKIIAAAQEERFTRIKFDSSFPVHAIEYVLKEGCVEGLDINYVAFYEKPFIKFERLLETYHAFAPRGLQSFIKAMPVWLKEKLYIKNNILKCLQKYNIHAPILFPEHHLSHAASAFYPSPFQESAILTIDGVGEWATTAIGTGRGKDITILKELQFPHSLGLFYSAFTYYCGFKVNGGEYKLMGLAPFGNNSIRVQTLIKLIKEHLIHIYDDGSFLLNMDYFDYATGLRMTRNLKWKKLFGVLPREPESEITDIYIDLACAVQSITEEIILKLVVTTKAITKQENLVLAGGVALNCVANGKILKSKCFKNIWIQPAAGDSGGALGAALAVWHIYLKKDRAYTRLDKMNYSYLGPSFTKDHIQYLIRKENLHPELLTEETLYNKVASLIDEGAIVGWFQGRMEFGPRALGNRSILADPRNKDMQKRLNLNIKYRESFRPFAPSVMEKDANEYFEFEGSSPYMLMTANIQSKYRMTLPNDYNELPYMQKLYVERSFLQAVTHVDFSARLQTVTIESNYKYFKLLEAFKQKTGCGVLVNTSFNVRGEPIVCTPEDAYKCFINTGMDYLIIGNYLFDKSYTDKVTPSNS
jgi:carbamoyltransferase